MEGGRERGGRKGGKDGREGEGRIGEVVSYVSGDALLFNAVTCQGEKAREGVREGRGRVGYRPPDT